MEPSTSGRGGLPGVSGQMQGAGPAGALPNAPVGYNMRKRCALVFAWLCCVLHCCSCWLVRSLVHRLTQLWQRLQVVYTSFCRYAWGLWRHSRLVQVDGKCFSF